MSEIWEQRLAEIPRVEIAAVPTPLEYLENLSKHIGRDVWIKRDDNTGLALGGNKARKLEFLVADAIVQNADVLLTVGGEQSNHARMTAAAARKFGMDAVLILRGCPPAKVQGNLLLDNLLGARVVMVPPGEGVLEDRMAEEAERLREQGHRPYQIPVGGSVPLGALGYVSGVRELVGQLVEKKLHVEDLYVAVGSCGTLSGIVLGARLMLSDVRCHGMSVSPSAAEAREKTVKLVRSAAALIEADVDLTPDEIDIDDRFIGPGYAIPTEDGVEAIRLFAQMEGILLDPVYTGKAAAGLLQRTREGESGPVVFWHTGGAPALFAKAEVFLRA